MTTIVHKIRVWGKEQNSNAIRSALIFLPVLIICGVVIIGVTILVLKLFGFMSEPNTFTLQTLFGVSILYSTVIGTILFSAYIWTKWLGQDGFAFIGFDRKYGKLFTGVLWGTGILLFNFIVLITTGWLQITSINFESQAIINILIITVSSINAGVSEEVLYRGVLYSAFRRHWGWWMTAIITAVLFASIHFIRGSYDFPIIAGIGLFIGGLLFAWAREITGSLWIPIGIHIAWDAAIGWFNLSANETPHILMTKFNAPGFITAEWGLSDGILFIVFGVSLFVYKRREKHSIKKL